MATIVPSNRSVTVYRPTVTGLPPLRDYMHRVWDRRPFIWHLARTQMKAQHYDTAMGMLWLIVDPVLMAATFYLVRVVFKGPGGSPAQTRYFIAHLIMGVSFFYYASNIMVGTAQSILGNKQMVLNTAAPRGVFPVVALVRALFDLGPTLLVYFVLHAALGQPWGTSLVFLPLIILLLTAFSLGFGLAMAPLFVFYRDVRTLLPYIIRIWMYVTPVMYTVAEIPASFKAVFVLNPLYPCFAALGQVFQGDMPSPAYLLASTLWAGGAMLVGGVAFLLRERDYAVRL